MTNYKSLTINTLNLLSLSLSLCLCLTFTSCDKKSEGAPLCDPITLNVPLLPKSVRPTVSPQNHGKSHSVHSWKIADATSPD